MWEREALILGFFMGARLFLQSLGIIHFSLFVQIGAQLFRIMNCFLFLELYLVLPASSVEAL